MSQENRETQEAEYDECLKTEAAERERNLKAAAKIIEEANEMEAAPEEVKKREDAKEGATGETNEGADKKFMPADS